MDADVLVLGAGFAGVAAARDLVGSGRRVIVLEARDRLGGRTWFKEIPGAGVGVEYGGMFFSRATQPNLAREIERYGIRVTPSIAEPASMAWVRGTERAEGPTALDDVRAKLAASNLIAALDGTAEASGSGSRSELARFDITSAAWIEQIDAPEDAADYLRAFLAAMGGSRIERTSVLPLLWDMVELDYNPVDAYIDMGELFTDGTKSLRDAMADYKERGPVVVAEVDGVLVDVDTVTLAGAAGVPIDFPADEPARAAGALLSDLRQVDDLEPVDIRAYDGIQVWLEAVTLLQKHFGNEIFIRGNCDQSPFTLASMLRGNEAWLMELLDPDQREGIEKLLQHCTGITLQFIRLMAATGVHMVSNGDSFAGPELISPALYREFALPYEQLVARAAHDAGLPYVLHICGNTGPMTNSGR